jgi:hypothetical protein
MPMLEQLARVLGGTVRISRGRLWLDTTVEGLRAAVMLRDGLSWGTTT